MVKNDTLLTLAAIAGGGYLIWQLTKPVTDTVSDVGGAVGGAAGGIGDAVSDLAGGVGSIGSAFQRITDALGVQGANLVNSAGNAVTAPVDAFNDALTGGMSRETPSGNSGSKSIFGLVGKAYQQPIRMFGFPTPAINILGKSFNLAKNYVSSKPTTSQSYNAARNSSAAKRLYSKIIPKVNMSSARNRLLAAVRRR